MKSHVVSERISSFSKMSFKENFYDLIAKVITVDVIMVHSKHSPWISMIFEERKTVANFGKKKMHDNCVLITFSQKSMLTNVNKRN